MDDCDQIAIGHNAQLLFSFGRTLMKVTCVSVDYVKSARSYALSQMWQANMKLA